MGDVTSILSTGLNVASDPYTQEMLCQVGALQAIGRGQSPSVCAETPDGTLDPANIGTLVKGLRAYVYAQANPWAYGVAAAVVIGLPLLVGYRLGQGSK